VALNYQQQLQPKKHIMPITIKKGDTPGTFSVQTSDGLFTRYPAGDYVLIAQPNERCFLIDKLSNNRVLDNVLPTEIINGDTGIAFANFSELDTYIANNFYRKAGTGSDNSGTVKRVSSATSDLTVTNETTEPVITLVSFNGQPASYYTNYNNLENKPNLDTKADLVDGYIPQTQLAPIYYSTDFKGTGTINDPVKYVADEFLAALQYLGSTLKGFTVGVNPLLSSGTSFTLVSGNFYGGLIKVTENTTLTGVQWMLAAPGATVVSTNENRIGLFSYDKGGVLTLVASTANNPNLYTQPSNTVLQEAFTTPYVAKADYYFLAFIVSYSSAGTPPAISATSFGLTNKVNILTKNSAKIAFKSLSAGKTALPSVITFSTDTNTLTTAFWAGVY
jgi:hypothetical protein